MAEKKEKDDKRLTARKWMERIKRSLKYREQVAQEQNWDRIQKEYEGKYFEQNSSVQKPPINLVFGYVDTAIARIYFRDPHMTINPRGAESINAARILELDVNYAFSKLRLKEANERVLKDTFLISHGWLKLGYVSNTGEMSSDPGTEPTEYIKDEEIFISYVPWKDIIFDTSLSKDPPHDCRWIAHRIVKPLSEMKDSKTYTNTGKLTSNVAVRDAKGEKIPQEEMKSDDELFEFWEVTDLDTRKVYAVCDQSDKYLREDDYIYEMKGLNYCRLAFNIVNEKPYPLSDIYLIEPQILEQIKIRAQQINHIKRWSRQLNVEEGAMTSEEMEKFVQGVDGAVTQRKKGFAPPAPIEYAPMQAEIFALDDAIMRDKDSVIGQSEVDRGGQAKTKTKTKYELQEIQQGTNVRQAKRQDKLEDFLEEVTEKYIALVKQFQDTPKYVRITGMKPEEIAAAFSNIPGVTVDATGIHFTKESIQGEYDIEAKAGSTLPLNRENKVKLLTTTVEMLQPLGIPPGSPTAIAVTKALFRELDMKEIELAYEQQAQQMAAMPPPQPGMTPGTPGQPPGAPPPKPPNVSHVVHHNAPPGMPTPP